RGGGGPAEADHPQNKGPRHHHCGPSDLSCHDRPSYPGRPQYHDPLACASSGSLHPDADRSVSWLFFLFDSHQVTDFVDHTADCRVVLQLNGLVELTEAQRPDGRFLLFVVADRAFYVGNAQVFTLSTDSIWERPHSASSNLYD